MSVQYAVMIDTDLGDVTDNDVGLYSGSFCWISGNVDGASFGGVSVPIIPVSGLQVAIWKTGMLIDDGFGDPSFHVDLSSLGSYGDQSDINLMVNLPKIGIDYFRVNNLNLWNRPIRFYAVVDGVFKRWWSGIIGKRSQTAGILNLNGIDASNIIHKDFPPDIMDGVTFPRIEDKNKSKPIPVCMGNVTRAIPFAISGKGQVFNIYKDGSGNLFQASVFSVVSVNGDLITANIITGGIVFTKHQLIGKYLVCIKNGPATINRIVDNDSSFTDGGVGYTRIYLGFGRTTDYTVWSPAISDAGKTARTNASWFEIHSYDNSFILSNKHVSSVYTDSLSAFDSQIKKFWNLKLPITSKQDGLPGYGDRAGVTIILPDQSKSSSTLESVFPIQAKSIKWDDWSRTVGTGISDLSSSVPSNGADAPNLYDKNPSTGYNVFVRSINTNTPKFVDITFDLEISLPEIESDSTFDGIFVAFDSLFEITSADATATIEMQLYPNATDVFGLSLNYLSKGPSVIQPYHLTGYSVLCAGVGKQAFYGIDGSYYGNQAVGASNNLCKGFLLNFIGSDPEAYKTIGSISVSIVSRINTATGVFDVKQTLSEVCVYGVKKITSNPDPIFIKTVGEGGVGEVPTPLGISEVAKYIIQNYDGSSAIDTSSFSDAFADRPEAGWTVGRQVLERGSSKDSLIELCQEGMFAITPKHNGNRACRTWPQRVGSTLFDESVYIEDSIQQIDDIDLQYVFNQFELNYDINPADNSPLKTIAVKNVDKASFPAATDLLNIGNDTVDITTAMFNYYRQEGYVAFTMNSTSPLMAGIREGTFISFTGGHGGFALDHVAILGVGYLNDGLTAFIVINDIGYTMLTTGVNYTDVTSFSYYSQTVLAWQTYVSGVPSYSTAASIWNTAHNAWLVTKSINTLKMDFKWAPANADWGLDPNNDIPISWLSAAISWLSKPNKRVTFNLPITSANLDLEVGTGFRFSHDVYTAGLPHYAWFEDLTLNTKRNVIEAGIIFFPWSIA